MPSLESSRTCYPKENDPLADKAARAFKRPLLVPIKPLAEPIALLLHSGPSPRLAPLKVMPPRRRQGPRARVRPDGTRRRTKGELKAREAREAEAREAEEAGEEEATAPFGEADAEAGEEEAAAPSGETDTAAAGEAARDWGTGKKRRRSSLMRRRARQRQLRDPLETHHGGNPGPGLRVGERGARPPLV